MKILVAGSYTIQTSKQSLRRPGTGIGNAVSINSYYLIIKNLYPFQCALVTDL